MTSGAVAGLVLAAGSGTRFGGGKVRAPLEGRPLVGHVLAAAREAGLARIVLVLGRDAVDVRAALVAADRGALEGMLVAVNGAPERGLASSLRLGLAAATAAPVPSGVLVLLGDQPRVRPEVIASVLAAAVDAPPGTRGVAPVYADDAAPNPVLLLPPAWALAARLEGDRGVGPFLASRPELVVRVPVAGTNPDVDTPQDLADLADLADLTAAAALEEAHP
jgi:CTP:molybdopterin cytidylyltransferase MocA